MLQEIRACCDLPQHTTLLKVKTTERNSINCKLRIRPMLPVGWSSGSSLHMKVLKYIERLFWSFRYNIQEEGDHAVLYRGATECWRKSIVFCCRRPRLCPICPAKATLLCTAFPIKQDQLHDTFFCRCVWYK